MVGFELEIANLGLERPERGGSHSINLRIGTVV